ncbi:hypothetical protein KGO95_00495 [Patescibacteria group bacterium]|nr:hypothetical protein [Patescibacteria group bacterium]
MKSLKLTAVCAALLLCSFAAPPAFAEKKAPQKQVTEQANTGQHNSDTGNDPRIVDPVRAAKVTQGESNSDESNDTVPFIVTPPAPSIGAFHLTTKATLKEAVTYFDQRGMRLATSQELFSFLAQNPEAFEGKLLITAELAVRTVTIQVSPGVTIQQTKTYFLHKKDGDTVLPPGSMIMLEPK